ncbi:MAG: hypothetical protein UW41_C0014G0003 [Candidatus Collierbacteria bacterium GW2011_GWC2_44_18]|uniref:Uncharacterized protein n=1 Tax=Candidatus Collierbacteria bacterium GW2011_GWC2_44_18 TaxID=1618392 RepID=A0A0G1KLX4_9BACT|nr:MAG: hypothetical protein UW41_C0014G0003 [Candidatus Collierbacteria bacterium GW2011_GWC2_44_18]
MRMIDVTILLADGQFDLAGIKPKKLLVAIKEREVALVAAVKRAIFESTGFDASVKLGSVKPTSGVEIQLEDCSLKADKVERVLTEIGLAVYFLRGSNFKREDIHITMRGATISSL